MKTKGLKIINKKCKLSHIAQKVLETVNYIYNKSQNTSIYYSKYKLAETVPCVGNWDQLRHFKYITVPRKFYMTMDEFNKKDARRKHYKNKIKSI